MTPRSVLVTSLLMAAVAVFGVTDAASSKCGPEGVAQCDEKYLPDGLSGIDYSWSAVRNAGLMCGQNGVSEQEYLDYADCIQAVFTPCREGGATRYLTTNRPAWYKAVCDTRHDTACTKRLFEDNVIRKCWKQVTTDAINAAAEQNPSLSRFCQKTYEANKCIVAAMGECGQGTLDVFRDIVHYAMEEDCAGRFVATPLVVG